MFGNLRACIALKESYTSRRAPISRNLTFITEATEITLLHLAVFSPKVAAFKLFAPNSRPVSSHSFELNIRLVVCRYFGGRHDFEP